MKNTEENKGITLTTPQSVLIAGVLVAVAVLVGAVLIVRSISSKNSDTVVADTSADSAGSPPVDINNVIIDNEPFIGNTNPKIVVAYWCDYFSAACANFEGKVFQTVIQNYILKGGDVAIVFKDNVTGGDASNLAALYGRAMWELYPEKYFIWRESVFKARQTEGESFGSDESILKLTSTIPGVDVEKVKTTLAAKKTNYQVIISNDSFEAKSFKITTAPGLITGKKLMQGAVSYEKLSSALNEQIK